MATQTNGRAALLELALHDDQHGVSAADVFETERDVVVRMRLAAGRLELRVPRAVVAHDPATTHPVHHITGCNPDAAPS
jgi:hypothetical protein